VGHDDQPGNPGCAGQIAVGSTASPTARHVREAAGLAPPPGRTFMDLPERRGRPRTSREIRDLVLRPNPAWIPQDARGTDSSRSPRQRFLGAVQGGAGWRAERGRGRRCCCEWRGRLPDCCSGLPATCSHRALVAMRSAWIQAEPALARHHRGIAWVIFDHFRPSRHIMLDMQVIEARFLKLRSLAITCISSMRALLMRRFPKRVVDRDPAHLTLAGILEPAAPTRDLAMRALAGVVASHLRSGDEAVAAVPHLRGLVAIDC